MAMGTAFAARAWLDTIGALIIRIGVPLRGPRVVGCYNVGALTIRIGFWGPVYYNYKKEPP